MAARLIWSNEALNDLSAIAEYISRDSPYHARRVTQEFFAIAGQIIYDAWCNTEETLSNSSHRRKQVSRLLIELDSGLRRNDDERINHSLHKPDNFLTGCLYGWV